MAELLVILVFYVHAAGELLVRSGGAALIRVETPSKKKMFPHIHG